MILFRSSKIQNGLLQALLSGAIRHPANSG